MTPVIAVEARHDAPTTLAFEFRDHHLYRLQPPALLKVIRGPLARLPRIQQEILDLSPRLLSIVGHGDGDTMLCFQRETLFEQGIHDARDVRGRIVHLLACETAQKLGAQLVKQGAVAFIGYDAVVLLIEEVFDAFMDCDTTIDLALLQGETVGRAHERARARFDAHIQRFQAEGHPWRASLLTRQRDSLRSPLTDAKLGDRHAKV